MAVFSLGGVCQNADYTLRLRFILHKLVYLHNWIDIVDDYMGSIKSNSKSTDS
jgi:hypothetical protein